MGSVHPVRAKVSTFIDDVTANRMAIKSENILLMGNLVIVKDGKQYSANGI